MNWEEQNKLNCFQGTLSWKFWWGKINNMMVGDNEYYEGTEEQRRENMWWGHFRPGVRLHVLLKLKINPLWRLNEVLEWDPGISGGGTSWAEGRASSKLWIWKGAYPILGTARNPVWLEKDEQWVLMEEGGQGPRWGPITEGCTGSCKDLGFYCEKRKHGEVWAEEWQNLFSLAAT